MRIRQQEYRARFIFDRVKSIWPDQMMIEYTGHAQNSALALPTITQAWDEAETAANIFREIDVLGTWAMYCVLHKIHGTRRMCGNKFISKHDARLTRFDYEMQRNLFNGYWKEERAYYLSVNLERHSVNYTEGKKCVFSQFKPHYRKNK